jgi:hypothetical protein
MVAFRSMAVSHVFDTDRVVQAMSEEMSLKALTRFTLDGGEVAEASGILRDVHAVVDLLDFTCRCSRRGEALSLHDRVGADGELLAAFWRPSRR